MIFGPYSALRGRRIMVVEDEPLIAMEIESILEDCGATVLGPAMRLSQGFALLEDEPVDAAILDIDLHGEEVFPLAEGLSSAGVPFLFHTSHAAHDTLRHRFRGAPICQKPVRMETLIELTASLLQ